MAKPEDKPLFFSPECPDDQAVSVVTEEHGTWPCCQKDTFSATKLLTNGRVELHQENYWLAPQQSAAEFVLDLGCNKIVNMVELVNTHNGNHRDRSSKEFKVSISHYPAGPWSSVVYESLEDSRDQEDPLPVLTFPFSTDTEVTARFVKFNLISWYGEGGGLQYFGVKKSKKFSFVISYQTSQSDQHLRIIPLITFYRIHLKVVRILSDKYDSIMFRNLNPYIISHSA